MIEMNLTPGKSVGNIYFGSSQYELPKYYYFQENKAICLDAATSNSYYSDPFGIRVDFDSNKLTTIACCKKLLFNGFELIGSVFNRSFAVQVFSNFKASYDEDQIIIRDTWQHIVYYDALGLGLWLDRFDVVRSVDCTQIWCK